MEKIKKFNSAIEQEKIMNKPTFDRQNLLKIDPTKTNSLKIVIDKGKSTLIAKTWKPTSIRTEDEAREFLNRWWKIFKKSKILK